MITIKKPWIKLKGTIDQEDYERIDKLQQLVIREDQTALKLELDYKLGASSEYSKVSNIHEINEFMYFNGQQMIGYIGISGFGSARSQIEVNGMVHPEYRRQGVFKTLFELVMAEWERRNSRSMLLLSDRESEAGQQFISATGALYNHTEYEMYLNQDHANPLQGQPCPVSFRKAKNADAHEIARQNAMYFQNETEPIISIDDLIMPEEEEERGMTIYLAEIDHLIIGKVHLQLTSNIGGIYGLGVLPEYRGKGLGRAILLMAVEKLKEANASEIMLQVATDNTNALKLYKSCGFRETSTMDYYEISNYNT